MIKKSLYSVFVLLLLSAQAIAQQYPVLSEQCASGDKEAQKLFEEAQEYRFGRDKAVNIFKAQELYLQAAKRGSIRALFDLGTLHEHTTMPEMDEEKQKHQALEYYTLAANAGCPEASYKIYEIQSQYALAHNQPIPSQLLEEAADKGAMIAMFELAEIRANENNTAEAKKLYNQALELGFGDAAVPLSRILFAEHDMPAAIAALRKGAKAGSIACLSRLSWIYSRGQHNQVQDAEYAACFSEVATGIDQDAPPLPIDDLDVRCPPKRASIYRPND